jgi:steroid 5-alpha reductase family enzyme
MDMTTIAGGAAGSATPPRRHAAIKGVGLPTTPVLERIDRSAPLHPRVDQRRRRYDLGSPRISINIPEPITMSKPVVEAVIAIVVALILAGLLAWAGSQGGITIGGVALFAVAGLIAFVVQWVVFVPSYRAQTEHWYDLTGSLTYLGVIIGTFAVAGHYDARALLMTLLISVWAARLGSFLFLRVRQAGADTRFDDIKVSFAKFLMAWTLQGLWIYVTLAAALAAMTATETVPLGIIGWIGAAVWAAGFGIEAVADAQKRAFRKDPANKGGFIHTGLWAWSRHPNYFGEILLWIGIALIALPALSGWQHVTLISPLFVYLLLTRASGIPILEERADKRWGDDPAYQTYKAQTPVLWPRPPAAAAK